MGRPLLTSAALPPKRPRFIRCASVDRESLESVFEKDLGWTFASVGHLPVSQDMAFELQRAGARRALPLGAIVDGIEFSLMRESEHEMPLDAFPSPPEPDDKISDIGVPYRKWLDSLMDWYRALNGSRLRLEIKIREDIDRSLRDDQNIAAELRNVLDSGGAIATAIRQLVELGLRPDHIRPQSAEGSLAKKLWVTVESNLTDARVLADYLFIEHGKFENQRDTTKVRANLEKLIRKGLGFEQDEPIRLAYHGLYFYTPLQWAIIDLLAKMGVEQVFIVHDDGVGAQFEVWRRFFFDCEQMQRLDSTVTTWQKVDPRASYFAASLRGVLDSTPEHLKLFGFPSVTDLARHVRHYDVIRDQEQQSQRLIFAAGTSDLNRKISRFGRLAGENDESKLLSLPVGRFLLGLQEAVRLSLDGGESGLDFSTMMHLVEGGFFNVDRSLGDRTVVEVLYACSVFFGGCRTMPNWRARLENLAFYYEPAQAGTGGILKRSKFPVRRLFDGELAVSDARFIADASKNHLRRAPWLDLTLSEWKSLKGSLAEILNEVDHLKQDEMVDVRKHIDELITLISNEKRGLHIFGERRWEAMRLAIERLPDAPSMSTRVTRIGEILPLMLGARLKGAENQFGESRVTEGLVNSLAAPLRSLESCGFVRKPSVHVTNLSDTVFPFRPNLFAWPFRRQDVDTRLSADDQGFAWRLRLIDELDRSGPLGDIYLLWLATNGSSGELKLTWLEESGVEKLNPSPILAMMLALPKNTRPVVRQFAGGIPPDDNDVRKGRRGDQHAVQPAIAENQLDEEQRVRTIQQMAPLGGPTGDRLDVSLREALASAKICGRRAALHWFSRRSVGYVTQWQLGILYGNLLGIKLDSPALEDSWKELLDRLFCWMTPAEKEKTSARSSIHKRSGTPTTAEEVWLLTLEGTKKDRDDRLSEAYKLAISDTKVPRAVAKILFAGKSTILPRPHIDNTGSMDSDDPQKLMSYLCSRCPASQRCVERIYPAEH